MARTAILGKGFRGELFDHTCQIAAKGSEINPEQTVEFSELGNAGCVCEAPGCSENNRTVRVEVVICVLQAP